MAGLTFELFNQGGAILILDAPPAEAIQLWKSKYLLPDELEFGVNK